MMCLLKSLSLSFSLNKNCFKVNPCLPKEDTIPRFVKTYEHTPGVKKNLTGKQPVLFEAANTCRIPDVLAAAAAVPLFRAAHRLLLG